MNAAKACLLELRGKLRPSWLWGEPDSAHFTHQAAVGTFLPKEEDPSERTTSGAHIEDLLCA